MGTLSTSILSTGMFEISTQTLPTLESDQPILLVVLTGLCLVLLKKIFYSSFINCLIFSLILKIFTPNSAVSAGWLEPERKVGQCEVADLLLTAQIWHIPQIGTELHRILTNNWLSSADFVQGCIYCVMYMLY